ncbi:MAG: hypothetical protein KF894_31580 [Labilithrix sp.]|nr:hypothetical protein [Labilithrix sp.]
MGSTHRSVLRALTALVVAGPLTACALLLDTSDLSSGAEDSATSDGAAREADGDGVQLDGALDGSVEPAPALGCPAAGHSCVPEPPSGWVGPLLVYDGPENGTPSCPAAMALARIDAHTGFAQPAPHACSACSCASGSGVTCTAYLAQHDKASCTGVASTTELTASCQKLASPGFAVTFKHSGGSCPPTGGVPSLTPVPWTAKTRACGAPSLLRTGCPSGNVCTPDAPSPFGARHCITTVGDVACPSGPYSKKLVAVGSLADDRGCTACTCGAPENNCSGTAHYFDDDTCSGIPNTAALPLACLPGGPSMSTRLVSATSITPNCKPGSDSKPTGSVAPAELATICCAP